MYDEVKVKGRGKVKVKVKGRGQARVKVKGAWNAKSKGIGVWKVKGKCSTKRGKVMAKRRGKVRVNVVRSVER